MNDMNSFTLENGSIAGLDSKRSDVGDDLGTGLEDDEKNTNRA
jgi:hypothetical protein